MAQNATQSVCELSSVNNCPKTYGKSCSRTPFSSPIQTRTNLHNLSPNVGQNVDVKNITVDVFEFN